MIILIRHAEPDFDTHKRIRGDALSQAIAAYDAAPLAMIPGPFEHYDATVVFASDKRRSIDSARAFFSEANVMTSTLYGEAELPTRLPRWIKLSFRYWLAISRFAWFLGYAQSAASVSQTWTRASEAANKLINQAAGDNTAVLVGHGIFNRFIGLKLARLAWEKQQDCGNGYGSWQIYQKHY